MNNSWNPHPIKVCRSFAIAISRVRISQKDTYCFKSLTCNFSSKQDDVDLFVVIEVVIYRHTPT